MEANNKSKEIKLHKGMWQNAVTSAEAGLKEAMMNQEMFLVTLNHARMRLKECIEEEKTMNEEDENNIKE